MPRILGVDIPANKKLEYSLRYIYGIGPTRAKTIVEASGFDPDRRAGELSEEEVNQLASIVADKQYIVEGDLRRERVANLKRLSAIRSNRGIRHQRGLPVRGQRTKTNARTRKGAVKPVRK
ncbi:30S ribosomal protein S13 [Coraliomargarita parva]|uniref:30S ribosomal protein S13 n=1 Tax=Coraliomargarita parva TaxID=3014050 RepID=UPI0022B54414|nr:30S ribosomal protein S13 [Coraliomargarita parva]